MGAGGFFLFKAARPKKDIFPYLPRFFPDFLDKARLLPL